MGSQPGYVDLATLKLALGIKDNERDALLTRALAAASRAVERRTGRRFWLDPEPTMRSYRLERRVVHRDEGDLLLVDDIGDTEGLTVERGSGNSWSPVTEYETTPDNALQDGRPVTGLLLPYDTWGTHRSRVRVTALHGWPSVPEEVGQAVLLQAARLFRRKDSPEGIAGSPDWGLFRLPHLDPDVRALIEPFRLPGF